MGKKKIIINILSKNQSKEKLNQKVMLQILIQIEKSLGHIKYNFFLYFLDYDKCKLCARSSVDSSNRLLSGRSNVRIISGAPKKGKNMKYKLNCHCGSVELEAETDLETIKQCNCSICKRKKCKNESNIKGFY